MQRRLRFRAIAQRRWSQRAYRVGATSQSLGQNGWKRTRRLPPCSLPQGLHCPWFGGSRRRCWPLFCCTFPAVVLVASIPRSWFAEPPQTAVERAPMVVYEFRHLTLPHFLPAIRADAARTAARHNVPTGNGANAGAHLRLGSAHFDPRITIVSNPPHPDNLRMTLKTENAPPDLKPPADIKIPDLISAGLSTAPPAPHFSPPAAKPDPKPDASAANSRASERKNVPAHTAETPPALATKPTAPSAAAAKIPQAPNVVATVKPAPPPPPPPLKLAAGFPDLAAPHLEVPPPPPVKPPAPAAVAPAPPAPTSAVVNSAPAPRQAPDSSPSHVAGPAAPGGSPNSGAQPKITALSVDPAPLKDVIPAGTREGAFSISPSGATSGVPNGAPGASDVGKGERGKGGENAAAAGKGNAVGGGREDAPGVNAAGNPELSISGPAGAAGIGASTLAPLKAEDLVYAVTPETPKAHAPNMVVSSGAWGGGGLRLFGVLHGDKIYTVYFPMPGKSWILQYCAQSAAPRTDPDARVVQIHFEPPLTPPAATAQFDFHRPASDPENSMIILHGIIREDGSVSKLEALQSRDPVSSAAALAAFARWKFKPAQRSGAPVMVEILVGIP